MSLNLFLFGFGNCEALPYHAYIHYPLLQSKVYMHQDNSENLRNLGISENIQERGGFRESIENLPSMVLDHNRYAAETAIIQSQVPILKIRQ